MTKYRPEHYSRLRVESVKHHSCWDSSVENEDTIEDGSKKKRYRSSHHDLKIGDQEFCFLKTILLDYFTSMTNKHPVSNHGSILG